MNIFEWFVDVTFYEIIERERKPLKPFIKKTFKKGFSNILDYQAGIFNANPFKGRKVFFFSLYLGSKVVT